MGCHLRPTPPSPEAARVFDSMRERTIYEAQEDRLGRVVHEAVTADGSTLVLTFENGERRVRMPTNDEINR